MLFLGFLADALQRFDLVRPIFDFSRLDKARIEMREEMPIPTLAAIENRLSVLRAEERTRDFIALALEELFGTSIARFTGFDVGLHVLVVDRIGVDSRRTVHNARPRFRENGEFLPIDVDPLHALEHPFRERHDIAVALELEIRGHLLRIQRFIEKTVLFVATVRLESG